MLSTFRLSKPSKQAKPKSLWNVKTSPDAERNTTHLVQEENRCCDVWTESSCCCRNKQQYGRLNVRNGTDGCCRNSCDDGYRLLSSVLSCTIATPL